MSDDLVARMTCVSATWTPRQRLHVGNVAWSYSRGDGSTVPDATFVWGVPVNAFADVWQSASSSEPGEPCNPTEVSLHVSPRASDEQRSCIVRELLNAFPRMTLEVSRQDGTLVETLARAGFREVEGPWFAQLWRQLGDLSDLGPHRPAPGYRIRSVDVADPGDVSARVEVHRRAWAAARIKDLLGLQVTGDEPGSSYSVAMHRAAVETGAYRSELDLVAVDPDGGVAAYALGWLDENTESMLFEPVGSDPAHSGRGLARALCAHMLRVARRLGAREAIVGPRGDAGYPLPRRVYEGLGMREVAQFVPMTNVGH